MKIAAWLLAAVITVGVIGGLVYVGTKEFRDDGRGTQQDRDTSKPIQNPEASSGKQTYHLDIDGVRREFIVYRPENLDDNEEVPVVFMFHGSGGNGEVVYKETGWKDEADEEGFMAVYPTGLKYHLYQDEMVQRGELKTDVKLYQSKWNFYGLEALLDPDFPNQTLADDVKFTREMVSFVQENYATDEDRFYVTGFSNGAQFTQRLSVEATDLFAAFAPVGAGAVPDGILEAMDDAAKRPEYRSVIQVIGADDPKLIHAAGVDEFTHDESAAEDGNAVKDNYISNYLSFEGLSEDYVYEEVGDAAHFTYSDSLVGEDNEYQIYVVDGMGHIYPNGKNAKFDAADYFWPFFEKYSL